jgi:single-strand DNA-binding protein
VAVDRRYQKSGEEKRADFINCVAWRQTAEFVCKYFTKGQRIGLEGRITTDKYQDKDGNMRFITDVDVNNVEFVESKGSNGGGYTRPATQNMVDALVESAGDGEIDDSNSKLPF